MRAPGIGRVSLEQRREVLDERLPSMWLPLWLQPMLLLRRLIA